jgi:hypothetical protein
MNKTLKRLAFATMLALSLVASTSTAFAKDARHGRETAWTDEGPVPTDPNGVTWENIVQPVGVTWEE